ncbi:MAG: SOS response-associated peptidase [Nitrospirae bacterium]|nr:SOS response-associated peptidase [Nitrospirota bacterium]
MCGRFVRSSPIEKIRTEFRVNKALDEIGPSYNIAPAQDILIINNEGEKRLIACTWGFIPSWAKDPSAGHKTINARAETVADKPMFRSAFKKHRCLVIADGFYEWEKTEKKKLPFYIRLRTGRPFGFGGLYSHWTSPEGKTVCTCTIITTTANALIEPIHDRMPVIIPKDREDLWLDPEMQEPEKLLTLLAPYPAELMEMYQVSTKVNNPAFQSHEAITPV